ncbi:MAG: 3'(2'),5'-bisphosphate nucleotidase CysQ [Oceanicaulis sp.]|nr:3'(2'),5'-bisphosphate nucleotidase CysQ [Oceanicaulis sp.]
MRRACWWKACRLAGAEDDRQLIARAARDAGQLALAFRARGLKSWDKTRGDPVSEADLAADALLKERLIPARPDYGWLSEETADDSSRLSAARSFVVDPIDGTRAFLKGRPEFVVSIAVIEDGAPLAAAIYDPSTERLWDAVRGAGARLNGRPVRISNHDAIAGARLLGDPGKLTALRDLGATAATVNSAALRLALAASGLFDGVVAVRPKWDWDLAAGHLLITEAGGLITDRTGAALRYDRDTPRQPAPLAAGPALHALLLERLAQEKEL